MTGRNAGLMIAKVGVVRHRVGMARVRAAAAGGARAAGREAITPGEHPAGMDRVRNSKVAGAAEATGVISAGMTGVDSSVSARSGASQWCHCRKSRLR